MNFRATSSFVHSILCGSNIFGSNICGLSIALAVSSCSSTPPGATDVNLALAKNQAAQGAGLFEQNCAECHGDRGQGLASAPVVIGGGALPVYPRSGGGSDTLTTDPKELQLQTKSSVPGAPKRQPFNTAKDVYEYVSTQMPPGRPGSLRAEDYYAVVTFMLVAHGSPVPSGGVTQANAGTIAVQP